MTATLDDLRQECSVGLVASGINIAMDYLL